MPWITLTRNKQIRRGGVSTTYHPGDSVKVGRQTALEWMVDGSALDPFGEIGPSEAPPKLGKNQFGIRIRAVKGTADLSQLKKLLDRVQVSYGPPAVPYEFTLIWRPDRQMSARLASLGFLRIQLGAAEKSWEMASPLVSLDVLASGVGSAEDRVKTQDAVGELRLPVYDSRVVWARKCEPAERVVAAWAEDMDSGGGEFHAFLRALYTNRSMLCTLPAGI